MFDQLDRSLVAAGVSLALIGLAWSYSSKVARVRPNEPPLLPGTVPILGHALKFGKDSNKLYIEARLAQDNHPSYDSKLTRPSAEIGPLAFSLFLYHSLGNACISFLTLEM